MKNNINTKIIKCIKCGLKTLKKYILHSATCINCSKIRSTSLFYKEELNMASHTQNKRNGRLKIIFSQKNTNFVCPSLFKMYVFYIENHLHSDYQDEYKKIEEIIEDIYGERVEFIYNYSLNITHHIVFDTNGVCIRSFEYIMSLVTGKYIISFEFLKKLAKTTPNENEYLVRGDIKFPTSMAPYKSLFGAHIKYFPRLKIYCTKKIFRGRIKRLIYTIGATYSVGLPPKLTQDMDSKATIHLCVQNTEELLDYFARWGWE